MSFSFTRDFGGRVKSIFTVAGVSKPGVDSILKLNAIWDTGAQICVVSDSKAMAVGLPVIGKSTMGHATGSSIVNRYIADLFLPNGVKIPNVVMLGSPNLSGSDMLIGMDVITLGDFCVTNKDGKTVVSFRIPSQTKIDFVKEGNDAKARQLKALGRNAPCPCGSGKKVKDCCGKGVV